VRLTRENAAECSPEGLAEECVDDRVGSGRHVAPPDHGRRDVGLAEPPYETRRTQNGDDVDDEERRPEHGESQ